MVSDDIIEQSQWKNAEQKSLTIEKVFTEHSYLKSAYTILDRVEPTEKFYPYIKRMATRTGLLKTSNTHSFAWQDLKNRLTLPLLTAFYFSIPDG